MEKSCEICGDDESYIGRYGYGHIYYSPPLGGHSTENGIYICRPCMVAINYAVVAAIEGLKSDARRV